MKLCLQQLFPWVILHLLSSPIPGSLHLVLYRAALFIFILFIRLHFYYILFTYDLSIYLFLSLYSPRPDHRLTRNRQPLPSQCELRVHYYQSSGKAVTSHTTYPIPVTASLVQTLVGFKPMPALVAGTDSALYHWATRRCVCVCVCVCTTYIVKALQETGSIWQTIFMFVSVKKMYR